MCLRIFPDNSVRGSIFLNTTYNLYSKVSVGFVYNVQVQFFIKQLFQLLFIKLIRGIKLIQYIFQNLL